MTEYSKLALLADMTVEDAEAYYGMTSKEQKAKELVAGEVVEIVKERRRRSDVTRDAIMSVLNDVDWRELVLKFLHGVPSICRNQCRIPTEIGLRHNNGFIHGGKLPGACALMGL